MPSTADAPSRMFQAQEITDPPNKAPTSPTAPRKEAHERPPSEAHETHDSNSAPQTEAQSHTRILEEGRIHISLTPFALSLEALHAFVSDPDAGATVVFTGATRRFTSTADSGQTHTTSLTYSTYPALALRTLTRITSEAVHSNKVKKVAVAHRLGTCKVGEVSIIVAVSAAHRREAFEVAEGLLERVKAGVEVWKFETFAGESERTEADEESAEGSEEGGRTEGKEGGRKRKESGLNGIDGGLLKRPRRNGRPEDADHTASNGTNEAGQAQNGHGIEREKHFEDARIGAPGEWRANFPGQRPGLGSSG